MKFLNHSKHLQMTFLGYYIKRLVSHIYAKNHQKSDKLPINIKPPADASTPSTSSAKATWTSSNSAPSSKTPSSASSTPSTPEDDQVASFSIIFHLIKTFKQFIVSLFTTLSLTCIIKPALNDWSQSKKEEEQPDQLHCKICWNQTLVININCLAVEKKMGRDEYVVF